VLEALRKGRSPKPEIGKRLEERKARIVNKIGEKKK